MGIEVADRASTGVDAEYLRGFKSFLMESLGRMYDRREGIFRFRVRKTGNGVVPEGLSRRYTAITLIGLSGEKESDVRDVLDGDDPADVYGRLLEKTPGDGNLGDVALTAWAGAALDHKGAARAAERLRALDPSEGGHPTVELSWALVALCGPGAARDEGLRDRVAKKLKASFRSDSSLFPHLSGAGSGSRSHVACFADLVYPVHALSTYGMATGDKESVDMASHCARRFCGLQGAAGQWWWHYDVRTGAVIEGYPVYAVHQDAMAPMALFELEEAGGGDFRKEIRRGFEWLRRSPELAGGTLVDGQAGIVWRKVARAEPGKASRYLQAAASRIHRNLRVPGLDVIFPPRAVDYEDRPYHIGWALYAWPERRLATWRAEDRAE